MIEIKSIIHSYKLKRRIARELYGNRDELTLLLNEFHNMKCTAASEKKKDSMLSRLQLIYQNMKLAKQYTLPIVLNNKLLERLENKSLQTIGGCVLCLHLMLNINYEKIK